MSDTLLVLLVILGFWLWFALVAAAKDAHAAIQDREDDRVMAAHHREEEARWRQYEAAHPSVPYEETAEQAAARKRDARGDYLVIYHPYKERAFLHSRYSTYERAAARCDELQPTTEYIEIGKEIFRPGWAVVQRLSQLAQTPEGRRDLRKLGVDPREA